MNFRALTIRLRRYFFYLSLSTIVFLTYILIQNYDYPKQKLLKKGTTTTETIIEFNKNSATAEIEEYDRYKYRIRVIKEKIKRLTNTSDKLSIQHNDQLTNVSYKIHAFYYAWYKSIDFDGAWAHWNHKYLPNWNKNDLKKYPVGAHNPPEDIGSNFYPQLGCYSSNDPQIIRSHMKYFKVAGIGVLVLSWAPPNFEDSPDNNLKQILDIALENDIKVSLQIEPYKNRNPENFVKFWKNFILKFGDHEALYKIKNKRFNIPLPLTYMYDSYLIESNDWKSIFSKSGLNTIRGTKYDGIFLGLLVDAQHKTHIKRSAFDGFYTYFASNGFSYGSSWKNWNSLNRFAKQNNLIFVPSVGPGYIDVRVRPWNSANTKDRSHGR